MTKQAVEDTFTQWALDTEPRLRQALVASFGPQVGEEAVADSLAFAWENWERIRTKANPVGYVYGFGRNQARRRSTARHPILPPVPEQRLPQVEPGLPDAIARLPERQRIVVTLLHGYEWTMSEIAELLGIAKTTVQNHAERGLKSLRMTMGTEQ